MTISAGFFFLATGVDFENRWNFSSIGLSVQGDRTLAMFVEAGAQYTQRLLGAPNRLVLSDMNEAYRDEPGFLDWRTDLEKTSKFAGAIVSIAEDMLAAASRVHFFFAPQDWRPDDRIRFMQGTLSRFAAEFDDVFPWGECFLTSSGDFLEAGETPVVFRFLPKGLARGDTRQVTHTSQ
jgi:hypothetical protein